MKSLDPLPIGTLLATVKFDKWIYALAAKAGAHNGWMNGELIVKERVQQEDEHWRRQPGDQRGRDSGTGKVIEHLRGTVSEFRRHLFGCFFVLPRNITC